MVAYIFCEFGLIERVSVGEKIVNEIILKNNIIKFRKNKSITIMVLLFIREEIK